jgi:hypothetical protein
LSFHHLQIKDKFYQFFYRNWQFTLVKNGLIVFFINGFSFIINFLFFILDSIVQFNLPIISFMSLLTMFRFKVFNGKTNIHWAKITCLTWYSNSTPSSKKVTTILIRFTLQYLKNIKFIAIHLYCCLIQCSTVNLSIVLKNMKFWFI